MKKLSRRNLLKGSLASLALSSAIDSFLRSYFFSSSDAIASSSSVGDKFYVGLQFHGGPARWCFDYPLYKDETEMEDFNAQPSNPMVITGWSANSTSLDREVGSLTGEYLLHSVSNLLLPPLWLNTQPTNLSDLASSCIFIRGLKNLSIHPAWVDIFAPRLGSRSIPGIIPSFSDASIPCIFFDVDRFDLGTGKSKDPLIVNNQVNWNGVTNNLSDLEAIPKTLIEPYQKVSQEIFSEADPRMVNVRKILKRVSIGNSINNKSKYRYTDLSLEAMEAGLESIITNFGTAFDDYADVFQRAMIEPVLSVDDTNVYRTNNPDSRFSDATFARYFSGITGNTNKLNESISLNGSYAKNNQLCAGLALSEVLIKSSVTLSRSFLLNGGSLNMVNSAGSLGLDGHSLGAVPNCFFKTKYFQGVAHLLNTFKNRLTSSGHWSKTLVHLGGEFNRSARFDGSGSDHGGDGSCATLITGIKNAGVFVGEVDYTKATESDIYKGFWGQNSSSPYTTEMLSNLIEHILGVPSGDRAFKDDDDLTKDYISNT
tara:strand:- start:416 stop:2038 length:1623 start_codon:yes stop_codon:yes gene_type:complete